MKKIAFFTTLIVVGTAVVSCSDQSEALPDNEVSPEILSQLVSLGFNIDNQAPIPFEGGYLVEGDIYLTDETMAELSPADHLPEVEQYSTNNLVATSGSRTITMYAREGGRNGYSPAMIAGLDEAIRRYNAQNLEIRFRRITTNSADITMTRLSRRDERRGVLGSAGFPTSSGDPYSEIRMSGILESTYGLGTDGIATIIAHEMGHCVGFRHTDYFNRSISCGQGGNEGSSGVGANLIPGTPAGASLSAQSWMLACTDGSNRPFNSDDRTALNYLY